MTQPSLNATTPVARKSSRPANPAPLVASTSKAPYQLSIKNASASRSPQLHSSVEMTNSDPLSPPSLTYTFSTDESLGEGLGWPPINASKQSNDSDSCKNDTGQLLSDSIPSHSPFRPNHVPLPGGYRRERQPSYKNKGADLPSPALSQLSERLAMESPQTSLLDSAGADW